jgi:hypothetical protein
MYWDDSQLFLFNLFWCQASIYDSGKWPGKIVTDRNASDCFVLPILIKGPNCQ